MGLYYWKINEDINKPIKDYNEYLENAIRIAQECHLPTIKIDDAFVPQANRMEQLSGIQTQKKNTL
jgi:hypothetical protein